ncbi:PhzF family phenazine biosynthesis protein [Marivita hallyeonensis]|uniref:Phenazine biosynthesis protein PhzF family n=1 Tax=Marivita hallyeonensis TaxID=996342 RepID=A0A1M5TFJ7_9RHOB|nr:PhzF family phenazine biosynthesis protein [Marivita hallyeonensis]SHH49420.1 phenazine biosynthesis protein PhzF family [Marivita hallyeonensis]
MKRRFVQVDVFASEPTKGNGLAVVIDSEGLSTEHMQAFAAWTNLAETTFLLPPSSPAADYRVRIFTPAKEMPFAGHPTLGSCAAWRHVGGRPKSSGQVVQECEIGLVAIDLVGAVPAFVAPPTRVAPMPEDTQTELCEKLKIDASLVLRSARLENGPVWQLLELQTAADVLAVDANLIRWPEFSGVSLLGAYGDGQPCDFEIRNVSPSSGMSEDPITGSLNAAVAKWMQKEGRLKHDLTIAQGTAIGRTGRVYIRLGDRDRETVLIGGESQIVIEGSVFL